MRALTTLPMSSLVMRVAFCMISRVSEPSLDAVTAIDSYPYVIKYHSYCRIQIKCYSTRDMHEHAPKTSPPSVHVYRSPPSLDAKTPTAQIATLLQQLPRYHHQNYLPTASMPRTTAIQPSRGLALLNEAAPPRRRHHKCIARMRSHICIAPNPTNVSAHATCHAAQNCAQSDCGHDKAVFCGCEVMLLHIARDMSSPVVYKPALSRGIEDEESNTNILLQIQTPFYLSNIQHARFRNRLPPALPRLTATCESSSLPPPALVNPNPSRSHKPSAATASTAAASSRSSFLHIRDAGAVTISAAVATRRR